MAGTRTSNRLTALAVDKQRRLGLYADGAGLTLVVTDKGVKRWELRAMTNGRRRQLGLGVYPQISLEAARRKAAGLREALREGAAVPAARQPRLVMSSVTPAPVTFRAAFVWRRSMTTTAQPDALPGKAQLSAWLLCRKPAVLRFRDIGEAVHKLAPRSTVKSVLEDGALLLEVDGIAVAVFTVEGQAPASLFDVGPYPHLYMRGPVQVCRDHKGYLIIQAPGDPADKAEALAKARAVTLVTRAAASSTDGIAASWLDAGQLTPISILDTDMKLVAEPDGVAPNFWIRKLVTGGAKNGELVFGTRGLAAFGASEMEWAPSRRPLEEMLAIVTATVRYALSSPNPFGGGHVLTFDAAMKFHLKQVEVGQFAAPVLRATQES